MRKNTSRCYSRPWRRLPHGHVLALSPPEVLLLGRVGPFSLGYFIAARVTKGVTYARGSVQIG